MAARRPAMRLPAVGAYRMVSLLRHRGPHSSATSGRFRQTISYLQPTHRMGPTPTSTLLLMRPLSMHAAPSRKDPWRTRLLDTQLRKSSLQRKPLAGSPPAVPCIL